VALIPASRNLVLTTVLSMLALSLSGCGAGTQVPTVTEEMLPVGGSVHGGQQPVVGATVTLVAAGTTGYGSTPTVLATTTSVAGGQYTLPAHGACPTPDSLV
jgi:hypothetical protein